MYLTIMATQQTVALQQFVSEIGGNYTGMLNNSLPGEQMRTKQITNHLNDAKFQSERDHYTNQLKKQFGGDTRAWLKAKLAANSS